MKREYPSPHRPAVKAQGSAADPAEAVRQACIHAALQAAEDAGIRGICAEGRLEAAIDAIRELKLDDVISGS